MNAEGQLLVVAAVRDYVQGAIRDQPSLPFHQERIWQPLPKWVPEQMGIPVSEGERFATAFSTAIGVIGSECPGLRIELRKSLGGIDLSMVEDGEWVEAIAYAFGVLREHALLQLSAPAAALLERIENGELTESFISELSIRRRIHFYGYHDLTELLDEIRAKRGVEIRVEKRGDRYPQRSHLLQFVIVARGKAQVQEVGLNPILMSHTAGLTARGFKRWFCEILMDASFEGNAEQCVWSIGSKRDFRRCFGALSIEGTIDTSAITDLLAAVKAHPAFRTTWDFGYRSGVWRVAVRPVENWHLTKETLRAELAEQTLEERYGLSPQAAAVFEWIHGLGSAGLEFGLTPVVEKSLRDGTLLLECPWDDENLQLYLEIICHEICARTPLKVRPVKWREGFDQKQIRIWVQQA